MLNKVKFSQQSLLWNPNTEFNRSQLGIFEDETSGRTDAMSPFCTCSELKIFLIWITLRRKQILQVPWNS